MSKALLEVKNLSMHYDTMEGNVDAVKNISFEVNSGESFGLVGESGCGKTSVAMTLLQLQPDNSVITQGSIKLDGKELIGLSENDLRKVRWDSISIVFQGAMNAWNPVIKIGEQIREAMREHYPENTKQENMNKIIELFRMVGLDESTTDRYPHELSGGMKQRAVIALALSCDPKIIIADEPTTALDVVIQDQILNEIKKTLQRGERVELRGFGVFSTRLQKESIRRNPKSGEKILVKKKRVIHWKMSKELFKKINNEKE